MTHNGTKLLVQILPLNENENGAFVLHGTDFFFLFSKFKDKKTLLKEGGNTEKTGIARDRVIGVVRNWWKVLIFYIYGA